MLDVMAAGNRRKRGSVDRLPSGAYRVRGYAGKDPVTGKRLDLVEVAAAAAAAEKVRTKLLSQLDERRNARTKATVNELLDRYLEVLIVADSTRAAYQGYIDNHIRPALGKLKVGELDGETLDRFYAQLRRCRVRCTPQRRTNLVDHRTGREHECDERCRPHVCRPLSSATIRQIHWILSGALTRAVRWRWIATNPVDAAQPPSAAPPNPHPPTAAEAARILQAAWDEDPMWGAFIWVAMTTGARRGEMCAIRRSYIDLDRQTLALPRSISQIALAEKDTKTHQQRRITLDAETVEVIRTHLATLDDVAESLGVKPGPAAFVFSYSPTGDKPMHPSTVTHRYGRLVERLGIETTLHSLRHYNATELIAAGVDIRTVAGRLGHGGGGTTTLRVYAAWVSEADQRAATALAGRLQRPGSSRRGKPGSADPAGDVAGGEH
jgi:integrase